MRGDTSSDGYNTLYNHPTDRHPLGQTGLLEERPHRAHLHSHAVNAALRVKLQMLCRQVRE
jgi:hypothetical protein